MERYPVHLAKLADITRVIDRSQCVSVNPSKMSMLSDGTSEDESLEDVVLALMKGSGLLSQMKGEIAKFILDSGKITSKPFIIPERADGEILTCIYEYLQWIGMKQTCSVLLSESPEKIDTFDNIDKSKSSYRPKLHALFQTPLTPPTSSSAPKTHSNDHLNLRETNSKMIIHLPKTIPTTVDRAVPAKSFDDLQIASALEKPSELSFLTSTPSHTGDNSYVRKNLSKDEGEISDSTTNLLMGFDTPIAVVSETALNKFKNKRLSFDPEKLFNTTTEKKDPFAEYLSASLELKEKSSNNSIIAKESLGEDPTKMTKSDEQFLKDEERVALEEQGEDLGKMEDEVMNSSLSTVWSEEDLHKANENNESMTSLKKDDDEHEQNSEKVDVDVEAKDANTTASSDKYEVSDDFEEDKDSSSSSSENIDKEEEGKNDSFADQNQNNINNKVEEEAKSTKCPVDIENIKPELTKEKENKTSKSPPKISEASAEVEEGSTSDILSLDLEDEDTQDVSIPSNSDMKGMSQCDHNIVIDHS